MNPTHRMPDLTRRRFLSLAGLTVGGLALGACGSSSRTASSTTLGTSSATTGSNGAWDAVVAAAKREGSVQVWSVLNPSHDADTKAAFEAAYPGINLTFTSYTPAEIETRVDAEHAAHAASVDVLLNIYRTYHAEHMTEDYWKTITGPDVLSADKLLRNGAPDATDNTPVNTEALYYDDTLLITLFGPWGYAWNKDSVKTQPTFASIFQTNQFKNAIGMLDPNLGGNTVTLLNKLNTRYPGMWSQLGKLHPTYYESAGTMSQALAAGAVDVALTITEGAVASSPNLGFAYDNRFPVLATTLYAEVLASAKSPNAAQVFVDWLMTTSGQTAWCKGYASVLPNISSASLSATSVEVFEAYPKAQASSILTQVNAALGR